MLYTFLGNSFLDLETGSELVELIKHDLDDIDCKIYLVIDLIWFIVFNATFSNISAIAWWPVLVVEEAGVSGENHRPWASNW